MKCKTCEQIESELKKKRITREEYVRKLDLHHHEERKVEIKEEISKLTNATSLLREELEIIKLDISSLESKKILFLNELGISQKEQIRIDNLVTQATKELYEKQQSYQELKIKMDMEIIEHIGKVPHLSMRVDTLNQEIDSLQTAVSSLSILKIEKEELSHEISQMQVKYYDIQQETTKVYRKLEEKQREVEELVAKNGKVFTQSEVNLGRLDIYVRRLQRYYEESGIKMNILPSFGLSPEKIVQTNGV